MPVSYRLSMVANMAKLSSCDRNRMASNPIISSVCLQKKSLLIPALYNTTFTENFIPNPVDLTHITVESLKCCCVLHYVQYKVY